MIPRRAKPMEAMDVLDKFGKRVLSRNQIPVLFPEGTRTKDGNVGKFYSAGFRKLSEATGLPVVACALEGGYQLRDLRKIFTKLKRGSYRVKILKVYDAPKTKDECTALLDDAREVIQAQVEEWRKLKPLEKY
jgi:1-acyl-sn-glycerol-3-phosphate acyltransferase